MGAAMATDTPRRTAMRANQKPWPPAWKWTSAPGPSPTVSTGDGASTATRPEPSP